MIKTDRQLRAYGDNDDWCAGTYGAGTSSYDKCVVPGIFPPWTIAGKAERGLPQTDPYALAAKATGQAAKDVFAPERAPETAPAAGKVTSGMIDTGAKVLLYGSLVLLAGAIVLKTRRGRRGYRRAA